MIDYRTAPGLEHGTPRMDYVPLSGKRPVTVTSANRVAREANAQTLGVRARARRWEPQARMDRRAL